MSQNNVVCILNAIKGSIPKELSVNYMCCTTHVIHTAWQSSLDYNGMTELGGILNKNA